MAAHTHENARARNKNYVHKFENCKLYFAKIRYLNVFLQIICICQKKVVPLQCQLKNQQLKLTHYEKSL